MSEQPKAGYVGTVGALRAHIAGLPDDARVLAQVKANDGAVWNVAMDVGPVIGAKPPAVGVSVSHPRLRALVEGDAPTMCAACLGHRHNDCDSPDHACGCPECARAFGGARTTLERLASEGAADEAAAAAAPHEPMGAEVIEALLDRGGDDVEPPDGGRLADARRMLRAGEWTEGDTFAFCRECRGIEPGDWDRYAAEVEKAEDPAWDGDREWVEMFAKRNIQSPRGHAAGCALAAFLAGGPDATDPDRVRPEVMEAARRVMDAHAETMWRLAVSEREDLTVGKALAWAREADEHTTHAYELEESLSEALGRPLCRRRCGRPGCRPCALVAAGNAARAKGEGEGV